MTASGTARFKKIRWSFSAALLTAGIVLALSGAWRVCSDQVASVGHRAVVETCRGPNLLDAPVGLAGFLALIVIWPELSELGIAGVSMKRRDQPRPDLSPEGITQVARETSATPATPQDSAALASIPNLRFGLPVDGAASGAVAALLATWSVTEAVLLWLDNEKRRVEVARDGLRVIHPPLLPLLGTEIPPEYEDETLSIVNELLKPYQDLISAARSARNLLVHSGQSMQDDVLTALTEGLTRMHGAIRLAAMHIVESG